jgi:hypothetical protein
MVRFVLLLLLTISCLGCTQVTVKKDPGPNDKGFRYYRPKPYLMITPGAIEKKEEKPTFTSSTSVKQGAPLKIASPDPSDQSAINNKGVRLTDYSEGIEPGQFKANVGELVPPKNVNRGENDSTQNASSDAQAEEKIKASISLIYLPDFAEEYSVRLRPGLGIGELSMKLENGWNLTSVGMKTDQQTAEIINSVANLVGSAGKTFSPELRDNKTTPIADVLATNIPFGLYEAVISEDPCGRKQLYGWRYVGFMPFQSCPVQPCGMESMACNDPSAIYGMVIDISGTMRFEKIAEIPHMQQKIDRIKLKGEE